MGYALRQHLVPAIGEGAASPISRNLAPGPAATMRQKFCAIFDIKTAETSALLEEAFRLRYQVYCVENPFENPEEHLDGREIDQFDPHSVHSLLIHRETGKAVGAVRLVLPNRSDLQNSFPIQHTCREPLLQDSVAFPLQSMGELSRFALSKEFRRRSTDTLYGTGRESPPRPGKEERRTTPPMRLGLMQGIVRMSVEAGLTHWCAVMEPALIRILRATAIHFEPIGGMVSYHGLRQPCYGNIREILVRLRREQPEVWDLVTDGGELWEMLCGREPRAPVAAPAA